MLMPLFLTLYYLLSLVFLLPLKDDRGPYRSFPLMTLGLVSLNTGIHVLVHGLLPWWIGEDEAWRDLMLRMMLVPADILAGGGLGALSMGTSAFLHGGLSHLVGNMFLEQEFQAYGYLFSLVGSFAHLGGVIAGLTCLYFFLPRELIHYRYGADGVL